MQSTSTRSRSSSSSRSSGIEAGIVQQRRGAAQPRRHEHVAGRLGPAAGRGAPAEVSRPRPEPVLRLHGLPRQIPVPVPDRLGLPGGAGGEHDQRRVVRAHVDRGGRLGVVQTLVGHGEERPVEARLRHRGPRRARPPPRRAARPCPFARAGRAGAAARCTAAPPRRCRQAATIAYTHSGRLPTSVITTSPRRTPAPASAPASRAERSDTSPKSISRRPPSRASATSAGRAGSARVHHVAGEVHPAVQRSPRLRRSRPSQAKSIAVSTICRRGTLAVVGPPVGHRLNRSHEHLGDQQDPVLAVPGALREVLRPRLGGDQAGHHVGHLGEHAVERSHGLRVGRPRGRASARRRGAPPRSRKNASRPVARRAALPSTLGTAAASRSYSSAAWASTSLAWSSCLEREVLVDERLRHARLARDVVDRGAVVAAGREDRAGGVEDRRPARLGGEPLANRGGPAAHARRAKCDEVHSQLTDRSVRYVRSSDEGAWHMTRMRIPVLTAIFSTAALALVAALPALAHGATGNEPAGGAAAGEAIGATAAALVVTGAHSAAHRRPSQRAGAVARHGVALLRAPDRPAGLGGAPLGGARHLAAHRGRPACTGTSRSTSTTAATPARWPTRRTT